MTMATERDRCSTGVPNADRVLDGGLLAESATLLRGAPGAGKTIFGLHFLTADPADTGLYINLGEPPAYLHETADRFDRSQPPESRPCARRRRGRPGRS